MSKYLQKLLGCQAAKKGGGGCSFPATHLSGLTSLLNVSRGTYELPIQGLRIFWKFTLKVEPTLFPSGNDYTNHTILLYSAPPRRDHIVSRTSQHFSNVSLYSMSLKLPLSASKESISLFSPYLQAVTQLSFCLLDLKDLKAAPLLCPCSFYFHPIFAQYTCPVEKRNSVTPE